MALALVACAELPASSSPASNVLTSCGASPSFAGSTQLKRWDSFPIDVHIDLSMLPEAIRDAYREGIERGVGLWAEATEGRIGAVRVNYDWPNSPVKLSIARGPLPDDAIGSTELTFTSNRIVSATVQLTRSQFEGTAFLVHDVASTTAHEMGHVLGIIDHSPFPEDKMWVSGNFDLHNQGQDPLTLLTARDVNTLNEAYCRS